MSSSRPPRELMTLKGRVPVPGSSVQEKPRRPANPSGRDADPRRTVPLNSTTWRKMRDRVLAEEPLCRMCQTLATDVDHVSGDPSDNSRGNLQPLCHACHSHKTGRERAGLPVIHGHDVHGLPLDPNHPWNQAEKSPDRSITKTGRSPLFQRYGRER